MPRVRNSKSTTSFDGLGLDKKEDADLQALLKFHDCSAAQLKRTLIRRWMKDKENTEILKQLKS